MKADAVIVPKNEAAAIVEKHQHAYSGLVRDATRTAKKAIERLNERLEDEDNKIAPVQLATIADRAVATILKLETLAANQRTEEVTSVADIQDRARLLRSAAEELLKRGEED